jgi:hypothetical protein
VRGTSRAILNADQFNVRRYDVPLEKRFVPVDGHTGCRGPLSIPCFGVRDLKSDSQGTCKLAIRATVRGGALVASDLDSRLHDVASPVPSQETARRQYRGMRLEWGVRSAAFCWSPRYRRTVSQSCEPVTRLTNHRIRRFPRARLVRGTSCAIVNADQFNVRVPAKPCNLQ